MHLCELVCPTAPRAYQLVYSVRRRVAERRFGCDVWWHVTAATHACRINRTNGCDVVNGRVSPRPGQRRDIGCPVFLGGGLRQSPAHRHLLSGIRSEVGAAKHHLVQGNLHANEIPNRFAFGGEVEQCLLVNSRRRLPAAERRERKEST